MFFFSFFLNIELKLKKLKTKLKAKHKQILQPLDKIIIAKMYVKIY